MALKKWNMSIPWPKDNYVLTVTDTTFGASKRTENPMGTFEMEVFSPSTMPVGADEVTTAGVSLKHYAVTKVFTAGEVDVDKTNSALDRLKELYEKFDVDYSTFDKENPDFSGFIGKKAWVILRNKETAKRKDPTPEQKAAGEQGSILKDPMTGQEAIQNYPEIDSFWGAYKEV